jgi:phosphoribosyl-AMP cyclohydrolase
VFFTKVAKMAVETKSTVFFYAIKRCVWKAGKADAKIQRIKQIK